MRPWALRTGLGTLAISGALCAWGFASVLANAGKTRVLRVHLSEEPVTLDWGKSVHEVDLPLILNLQEGLTRLDSKLQPKPGIAESWQYDSTGTQLRFNLRSDARWSDGKPVTASDFLAAFKRVLSPSSGMTTSYFLFPIRGAEDFNAGRYSKFADVAVKAVSDRVLEVNFKEPSWRWILNTATPALFPIREEILNSSSSWTTPGMLTNGAFRYLSHTLGEDYLFTRRSEHKARTNVDEVHFVVSTYPEAIKLFRSGKLDLIFRLPTGMRAELAGVKQAKIIEGRLSRTRKLDVNKARFPTTSLELRRALAASIDKRALLKNLRLGSYVPATTYLPPSMVGHSRTAGIPFDRKVAKRYFSRTASDASPKRTVLEILVPYFDDSKEENREIAEALKAQWEGILGIRVKPVLAITPEQYLTLRNSGAYHLLLRDAGIDSGDPVSFYSAYASGSRFGVTWPDRKYDLLVQDAGRTKTAKELSAAVARLDDFLLKETVTLIPLFYRGDLTVVRSSIRGFDRGSWFPYVLRDLVVE